eukprot:CAMPEP_0115700840 /NCGR_PEP_ID=MMETSP0272-20121206/67632_1 /TAXON_ID=71861 /ORGANISM="Scrippsiella trochoidea, Strain CCMP3099" /LENGTH=90 /DNA_ID=CAMNT_0003141369 /DNA_START=330 /DNA_END=602 /DNA_ORIENTATION=-
MVACVDGGVLWKSYSRSVTTSSSGTTERTAVALDCSTCSSSGLAPSAGPVAALLFGNASCVPPTGEIKLVRDEPGDKPCRMPVITRSHDK